MHYYAWNNLIGNLLFNPSKAGQQVLLCVTREEVVQAALNTGCFETRDEAWTSFSRSPRRWFGSTKNLIECITDSLTRSQQITVGSIVHKTEYPVCLALLVQSVMPLIDGEGEFVSQADYYKRAAEYATMHGFAPIVSNSASQNWNAAWQQIQRWSATDKNSRLGRFTLNDSFGHIYVGKPFSQCLIPQQAIRDLPRAFVRAGWVPRQPLTRRHWQQLLTNHCYDLGFRQAALRTLCTDEGLNHAQAILQERFDRWDGTSQTAASSSSVTKSGSGINRRTQVRKEDTLARFFLTFPDLSDTEYRFDWQYRIRAGQPLPDTLHINEQTFTGQLGGWSNAVPWAFEEGKQGYDALNKWKVKWPEASIRLFESGQWHGLSSRIWVEVNELSRVNKMWAICRPDQKDVMRWWGTTFRAGPFKEYIPNEDFDATNWPDGYGLFAFERPTQGLPQAGYALPETRQLRFVGGLQLRFGLYDDCHRPTLQVVNGDGTEVVTAFTEAGQQIALEVHRENSTLYSFLGDVPSQTIGCRIVGTESTATCQFVQADDNARNQTYPALPGRNAFGDPVTDKQSAIAFTGFDVSGLPEGRLHFIKTSRHVFYPSSTNSHLAYASCQTE